MEHIALQLKDIFFFEKKGVLHFRYMDIQKQLYFREGNLVFARSNQPNELLGEVLFRLGKLSRETFSSIEDYIQRGKPIGEALVQKELVSREDLRVGLIRQMKEIALNAFPFIRGEFRFDEKEEFTVQEFNAHIPIPVLLEEGIRRMPCPPEMREFLKAKVPIPMESELYQRLTAEEKDLFGKIHGDSTSEALLHFSKESPEMFWKSLYLFYCLNLVELKEGEEAPREDEFPGREDQRIKEKLQDALDFGEELSRLDYYQILKISRTASPDEIKSAYFRMARKYHPDLFGRNLSPEIKKKIDDIFDKITKSYQTLRDKGKRLDYDAQLDSAPLSDAREKAKRAEVKFRKGKTLYDQGRYEDALVLLEEALRMDSSKASHFILLAMSQSQIPGYSKKAEANFLKATELEPWNPDNYVRLGLLYKKEGLRIRASKEFKRALSIDSDHKTALKELELMGVSEKKKGLKEIFPFDFLTKGKKKR